MSNRHIRAPRSRRAAAFALALGFSPLGLAPLAAGSAAAHEFKVGAITVEHPWSRETPPGASTGAGYLKLDNAGSADDRLVSAASPAAATTEIHEMKVSDGVMTMRPLPDGIAVPAGGSVALSPGGAHLMLMGLKQPLRAGDHVPVQLTFEKAGKVDVWLSVDRMGAPAPVAHDHHGGAGNQEGSMGHDTGGAQAMPDHDMPETAR